MATLSTTVATGNELVAHPSNKMELSTTKVNLITYVTQIQSFGKFSKIPTSTGANVYVLREESDYNRSMKLLDEAGLEPFWEREIIGISRNDDKVREFLKGKRFFIRETADDRDGIYKLSERHPEVHEGSIIRGKSKSLEENVSIWSKRRKKANGKAQEETGKPQLLFTVHSDHYALVFGRRYNLNANSMPEDMAHLVVGKPKPENKSKILAKILRVENDERLEITLADGQIIGIDAKAVAVVKNDLNEKEA